MDTVDFISKLEKNPANPTIFKLCRFSDQERQQFLMDMGTRQEKDYRKFVHRILRLGIASIKNFTLPGRPKVEDINRIDDRLISRLSILLTIELYAEIMQLNFRGGVYARK